MSSGTAKITLVLVGLHVLLGLGLLAIDATHGIDDQDASFVVALVFYYLNLPSIWLLRSVSGPPEMILVFLVGIVQWAGLAFVIPFAYRTTRSKFQAITGQTLRIAEESAAADAPKPRS